MARERRPGTGPHGPERGGGRDRADADAHVFPWYGQDHPGEIGGGTHPAEFAGVDEAAVPRPFAAVLDLRDRVWRYASPSVLAGTAGPPPAGPESLVAEAVRGVVQNVLRRAKILPSDLLVAPRVPLYLHLSGRASAADILGPECGDLIETYLASAKKGVRGRGVEIQTDDGGWIGVAFSQDSDPRLPALTRDAGPANPLPDDVLSTLDGLRRALIPRHQPIVGMVQQALDRLAGKHAPTLGENRAVAAAVNALTDGYGIALLYDGQPVALRVVKVRDTAGSFQVRLTGSEQKALKTSMAFPALTAVSKALVIPPPDRTPPAELDEPSGPADG